MKKVLDKELGTVGRLSHTMKAQKLKEIRTRLKLSQQALAEMIGVSRRSIYRWEQGIHSPHPSFERAIRELAKNGKRGAA